MPTFRRTGSLVGQVDNLLPEWDNGVLGAALVKKDTDEYEWTSDSTANPLIVPTYTVATLPSASSFTAGVVFVSNETGGAVLAFSDGTNWRRVTDRAIVS